MVNRFTRWFSVLPGIVLLVAVSGVVDSATASSPRAELVAIAQLDADTRQPGPDSAQFVGSLQNPAGHVVVVPLRSFQPVQGISAVLDEGDGRFLVLADNGYGTRANSVDFVLALYRLTVDFKTASGGSGKVFVSERINLSDPSHHAPFRIIADHDHYPGAAGMDSLIPVPVGIRTGRWLTGGDFDPESIQPGDGGTYWVGDEFGPWLLNIRSDGVLLQPPVPLPGISSPDNPLSAIQAGALAAAASGGFEGMAKDPLTGYLHVMLEKPWQRHGKLAAESLSASGRRFLPVYRFDPAAGAWHTANTGSVGASFESPSMPEPQPLMRYPLDPGASAVGAFQSLGDGVFLTIERDSEQGSAARIKRIYRFQQNDTDAEGLVRKTLVADLLDIADPSGLAMPANATPGTPGQFSFAYQTIESLVVLGDDRLGIINDNNFPFGSGPDGTHGQGSEPTLFIVLRVSGL